MKYLIQNRKEFIISLGVLVTILLVVFWCVWSIIDGSFTYKNLIAIAGEIFTILGWYYNMPTSEENCKHTGMMRLEKAYKNVINELGKSDGKKEGKGKEEMEQGKKFPETNKIIYC